MKCRPLNAPSCPIAITSVDQLTPDFLPHPADCNRTGVAPLIEGIEFEGFIADKTFDANWIIDELNARGARIVISQMPGRTAPLEIDRDVYKWRHLIENFFCKLKEFKRIAMRSEKTDTSFAAMIHLGSALINSR